VRRQLSFYDEGRESLTAILPVVLRYCCSDHVCAMKPSHTKHANCRFYY
jgi:hypothetical protein